MICKVMYRRYLNGVDSGCYGGAEYAFKTDLPLEIGSKVLVPSGVYNEPKRALVVDVNVDPETIDPKILEILKTIDKYDPEGGVR